MRIYLHVMLALDNSDDITPPSSHAAGKQRVTKSNIAQYAFRQYANYVWIFMRTALDGIVEFASYMYCCRQCAYVAIQNTAQYIIQQYAA